MSMTKQLTVGRLVKENGEFVRDKHHFIANLLADSNDSLKNLYKEKLIAIMQKDKDIKKDRMRLISNNKTTGDRQFEVHVQRHTVNETIILFFAIVDLKFSQSFSAVDLLNDFKNGFLDLHDSNTICSGKAKVIQKKSVQTLGELLKKYSVSKLAVVQDKVNEVASIMEDSIQQALLNSEDIASMDTKSDDLLSHADDFKKKSTEVKRNEKCKLLKTNAMIVGLVVAVIFIIFIAICARAC